MTKKILLVVILLSLVGGLFFWFSALFKKDVVGEPETGDTNFISEFFNTVSERIVGNDNEGNTLPEDVYGENPNEDTNNIPGIENPQARLIKVSDVPVAGYGISYKDRFVYEPEPNPDNTQIQKNPSAPGVEKVGVLRYVSKINGNILQVFFDNLRERKFTSNIIPGVQEAKFGEGGESVIMRYLKQDGKTISTYVAPLPKEVLGGDFAGDMELSGSFLPENIHDVSVSPDGTKIFYIYNTSSGTVGITSSPLGVNKVQVFDSQFSEWISEWANTNVITMTTKASGLVPGYVYMINPGKKSFDKVLGGIKGLLTKTSPDGKLVLFTNELMSARIYNIETKEITQLKINTLAEKCVWGTLSDVLYCTAPKSTDNTILHPDAWYQGEKSFSDENLWKIDIETGNEVLFYDIGSSEEGKNLDSSYLSLDQDERFLFFINSVDSTLWRLRLK